MSAFTKISGTLLAVVVLAVYPLLFLLQGIDFTDMGFNLSNQWLLLEDAGSYTHGHLFYLANLLGGLWLAATEPLGLLGAKLGWALVLYVTMYASFCTLKDSGARVGLLVGLIIALLWNTRIGTSWISYNTLTAMFFTLAAYFLVKGLARERPGFVLIAGALLGAAPFIRLPNILALGLVVVVPFYAHLAGRPRAWALDNSARFGLGYLGGFFGVLLLMYALGHLPLYWESLTTRLAASTSDAGYEYSGGKLLARLLQDYLRLLVASALASTVLLLAAWGLTGRSFWRVASLLGLAALGYLVLWTDVVFPRWFLSGMFILAALLGLASWMIRGSTLPVLQAGAVLIGTALLVALSFNYAGVNWAWVIPGLLFVALAFRYWRVVTAEERLIVVVAALMLLITPLGSSNGIVNAIFGMWLATPLAFVTLFDEVRAVSPRPWYSRPSFVLCVVASASLLLIALKQAQVATYRDSSDRARMVASIDDPFLRGALTTPERAIVVSELMKELPKYVSPGEKLLLHGGCALVHLLSKTRPVLGSTWNGVYSSRMFSERLLDYDASSTEQPTILLSKGSCRARQWPNLLVASPTEVQTRQELARYMGKHNYTLRWQNVFFEIWTK